MFQKLNREPPAYVFQVLSSDLKNTHLSIVAQSVAYLKNHQELERMRTHLLIMHPQKQRQTCKSKEAALLM